MTTRLHETSIELEVPFHDVDPLDVVWHGHYYKYLELARTKMLTRLQLDGEELLATGFRFFVIESRCRYAQPLHYRNCVRIVAWLREIDPRIVVAYEVFNLTTGRRAARAKTVLATVDLSGRLMMETPHAILQRIG